MGFGWVCGFGWVGFGWFGVVIGFGCILGGLGGLGGGFQVGGFGFWLAMRVDFGICGLVISEWVGVCV